MPHCSSMSMGTHLFISKLQFPYDKYSVDKVWTKIYCHFFFRGITCTLRWLPIVFFDHAQTAFVKRAMAWALKTLCESRAWDHAVPTTMPSTFSKFVHHKNWVNLLWFQNFYRLNTRPYPYVLNSKEKSTRQIEGMYEKLCGSIFLV